MVALSVTLVLLLSLLASLNSVRANWLTDVLNPDLSHAPRGFSHSQLYDLEDNGFDIGVANLNATVGCFGDFNSDKYTDIFLLNGDRRTIEVYLWNRVAFRYDSWGAPSVVHPSEVTSMFATDFDHNGRLDLLVYSAQNQSAWIYHGDYDTLRGPIWLPGTFERQPLVMDANNDLYPDVLGQTNGKPALWSNLGNGSFSSPEMEPFGLTDPLDPYLAQGFVDMNGDCLADLVVASHLNGQPHTVAVDILLNTRRSGERFMHSKRIMLPPGSVSMLFSDLAGDGSIDLLVATCEPYPTCNSSVLHVFFNTQRPLCQVTERSGCTSPENLCYSDPNYFLPSAASEVINHVVYNLPDLAFFLDPVQDSVLMHIGDFDLDGYPDLLVPVRGANSSSQVLLFKNVKCEADTCAPENTERSLRTFELFADGMDALSSLKDAYTAAFFDLGENGALDVLALVQDESGFRIHLLWNNFLNDAFFLKTLGLNGVKMGTLLRTHKPYGVNFVGGSFKITVSDLGGTKHMREGAQLSQSSHQSLQTPYVMFGLGRTSNYVEEFAYAIPHGQDVSGSRWRLWTGIIPNSQVVAIPYPPGAPEQWRLELYLQLGGLVLWVLVGVASALLFFGVSIAVFSMREWKQDQQLKAENAKLFSFDAL